MSLEKINKKINSIAAEAGDVSRVESKLPDFDDVKGATVIDHMQSLREMFSLISVVPMDDFLKQILYIRLSEDKETSTQRLMALATKHGVRWHVILSMEEEAKERIKEYLKKTAIEDAVGSALSDSRNKRDIVENVIDSEVGSGLNKKGLIDG